MDVDIREYIKNNFKDSKTDDIKESILESIKEKDDVTLPGLGVFFEILWQNCSNEDKDKILNILKNNMN